MKMRQSIISQLKNCQSFTFSHLTFYAFSKSPYLKSNVDFVEGLIAQFHSLVVIFHVICTQVGDRQTAPVGELQMGELIDMEMGELIDMT